jgi:hypothetical protein
MTVNAATPTGTLMKKIQRHPAASVTTPPSSGPHTRPSPSRTAAIALPPVAPPSPRSARSADRWPMTTMVTLISPPPPSPCRVRKTMSSGMLCAIPHSTEPATNTATAAR